MYFFRLLIKRKREKKKSKGCTTSKIAIILFARDLSEIFLRRCSFSRSSKRRKKADPSFEFEWKRERWELKIFMARPHTDTTLASVQTRTASHNFKIFVRDTWNERHLCVTCVVEKVIPDDPTCNVANRFAIFGLAGCPKRKKIE